MKRNLIILWVLSLTFFGCYPDEKSNIGDAGNDLNNDIEQQDLQSNNPEILKIEPYKGPVEGGTKVTIKGINFEQGLEVLFGFNNAQDIEINEDGTCIYCLTPPGINVGPVTVIVRNPSGAAAQVVGGFTYTASDEINIQWCNLQFPSQTTVKKGQESEYIYGRVFVPGVTNGTGQGADIISQVGYGPVDVEPEGSGKWLWYIADYNTDTGMTDPNDKTTDEYYAHLTINKAGIYNYAYRFSSDGGANWTYCDLDSSDNGFSLSQAGEITVEETELPFVDRCQLLNPASIEVDSDVSSESIYGKVYEESVTEVSGRGAGIIGQIGFGPDGTEPSGNDWNWNTADYYSDIDGNNSGDKTDDEYATTLKITNPGIYDFAYRFSIDGGINWLYCDLDGSDNGYNPDQAGALIVNAPQDPEVDWCILETPPEISITAGNQTQPIYGRVHEDNITQGSGQGQGLDIQLGWGPSSETDPNSSNLWQWIDAEYNVDTDGRENDEYVASITPPGEGDFVYAYRTKLTGTDNWLLCDLDGSANGFSMTEAGKLTVYQESVVLVDWCNLHYPVDINVVAGQKSENIYGWVYKAGVTPGVGQGSQISGQFGYGPSGTDPSNNDGWIWNNASYLGDVDGLSPGDKANDEYVVTITEDTMGTYDAAYRFTMDNENWIYCDLDGGEYTYNNTGKLHVTGPSVDWCQMEGPSNLNLLQNQISDPVTALVYKASVTSGVGQGADILGQICYGPLNWSPEAGNWLCFDGSYAGDVDGLSSGDLANDRWQATLTISTIGDYNYLFRFSIDGGATWTYCDLDPAAGYLLANAGVVTVTQQ